LPPPHSTGYRRRLYNNPKSGCQNGDPASEPPQDLLIVLVPQESPEPIHRPGSFLRWLGEALTGSL